MREKGHLSQTVVMSASVEQANTVRPGREEAGKAMGLVRGMVSRRRVGGRRNAGQEGAARKRHEESSRRTAPWPGGTQQRSKSRSELPYGHRMGTQRKVSAAVEAMSSADVHGMARHDGAPRALLCRVTRRNGRSRDRNRRTGT